MQDLNAQQKLAVETIKGRVLILAGAGCGKTSVLAFRMTHLINDLKVEPRAILGLTFTNKAAAEMRDRISSMVEPSAAKQICLCTFHSFCMQVLRQEISRLGYTPEFTLYTEKEVERLVHLIARDILEHETELPSLNATMAAITNARNQGHSFEQIRDTSSAWHEQFLRQVYSRLQDSMRAYNAVDFDHLLSLTVELFEKHSPVLEAYQEHYRYIMIDEYQDTNPIQYKLAALLSAKYQNLCVVGDDDQSIYGWRGADVRNILNFQDSLVIKLEQNYRSTNTILKAANAVICKNLDRHSKALWSRRGEGQKIEIFYAPSEIHEAEAICFRIAKLKELRGLKWKDIAVLYRSNALSRPYELALTKQMWFDGKEWVRGIPYQIFGGTEFYERREVKDLIAYLRIIVNPLDEEALLRVINQPRRGVGEVTLDAVTAFNRQQKIPLWNLLQKVCKGGDLPEEIKVVLPAKAFQGIKNFVEMIEEAKIRFKTMLWSETMQWFLQTMNYRKAIQDEVKSVQMRNFKWENLQEFISSMSLFQRKVEEELGRQASLSDFISTFSLDKEWNASQKMKDSDDRVNLLTLHSAKGLEFTACFLVGMEDHLMPHEKSVKASGVDEERRLMYVGLTRAKKILTLSAALKRMRMGEECVSQPSRFLFDIPEELREMTKWDELPSSFTVSELM